MQSVNKEAIKTLVVAYGQREAARQSGLNVNTVMAWARRYGWNQAKPEAHAIRTQSPADTLAESIRKNGEQSKFNLSKAAHRASESFAKMKGNRVILNSKEFKDITAATGQLHGWNEQQGQAAFSLNVLNLGGSVQIGIKHDSVDAVAHTRELEQGEETG